MRLSILLLNASTSLKLLKKESPFTENKNCSLESWSAWLSNAENW